MKIQTLILIIILFENLKASNNIDKIVDVSNNERGFAYYEKKRNNINKDKENINQNKDITKLLKKLIKINTEIRDILKAEYDPAPKLIINERGEECIANSSADCFEMPITNDAKKTPVYKNWLEKGDLESSLKKKQWEAKYFNEIANRAYMDMAALMQFGTEAYPVNYNTSTHNNTTGYATTVLRNKIEKEVLKEKLDKVNFIYFIGIDNDMDLYAMDNIVKFLKQYKNKIKLQFIFKDKKSKEAFSIASSYNSEFSILNKYKMSVLPEEFKNFNIYTTPSLVAINKEKKTGQTILTGRASDTQTNRMVIMYLRSQGLLKDVELNPNKGWKKHGDFGQKYIEQYLGKEFTKKISEGEKNEKNIK